MTACSNVSILKEATTVHVTSFLKQIPPTGESVLVSVIRNSPSKNKHTPKVIYIRRKCILQKGYVIRRPEGPRLKADGIVLYNMEQPKPVN